jgi:hypothetical protein
MDAAGVGRVGRVPVVERREQDVFQELACIVNTVWGTYE